MATIKIKTPDGKTLKLTAPEGATPDQIREKASQAVAAYKQQTGFKAPQPAAPVPSPMAAMSDAPSQFGRVAGVATQQAAQATGISPMSMVNPGIPVDSNAVIQRFQHPGQVAANLGRGTQLAGMAANASNQIQDPNARHAATVGQVAAEIISSIQPGAMVAKATGSTVGKAAGGIKNFIAKPGAEEARAIGEEMVAGFRPQATEKAAALGRRTIGGIQESMGKLKAKLTELANTTYAMPDVNTPEVKAARSKLMEASHKLRDISLRLKSVDAEKAVKTEALKTLEQEAKQALQKAEEHLDIKLKSTPKFEAFVRNPKKVAQLANRMERFGSKSPEQLAESMTPQRMQLYRKLGQEAKAGVSQIGNAQIQKGREQLARGIATQSEEFAQGRSRFHDVKTALAKLPDETKAKKQVLVTALDSMKGHVKSQAEELKTLVAQTKEAAKNQLTARKKTMANELKQALIQHQDKLRVAKSNLAELHEMARHADAAELATIRQQAAKLVREGVEKDRLVKKLVVGAVGVGVGSGALKSLLPLFLPK